MNKGEHVSPTPSIGTLYGRPPGTLLALVRALTAQADRPSTQSLNNTRCKLLAAFGLRRAKHSSMHERTKEVDGLRRLADLLRQAVTAATEVVPTTKKQQALRIKKLHRSDTPIAAEPQNEPHADRAKTHWGSPNGSVKGSGTR